MSGRNASIITEAGGPESRSSTRSSCPFNKTAAFLKVNHGFICSIYHGITLSMDMDFLEPADAGVQLSVPPSILAVFTTIKITAPLSTWSVFYSYVAFRFCGLTHRLRLVGPTRLVPRLIYIPATIFERRVILTSTAGSSRHNVVTYGSQLQ